MNEQEVMFPSYASNYNFTKGTTKQMYYESDEAFINESYIIKDKINKLVEICNEKENTTIDERMLIVFNNKELLYTLIDFNSKARQYIAMTKTKGVRWYLLMEIEQVLKDLDSIINNLYDGLVQVSVETKDKIQKLAPEMYFEINVARKIANTYENNNTIDGYVSLKDTLVEDNEKISSIDSKMLESERLAILKKCIKSSKNVCNSLGYKDKLEKTIDEGFDLELLEKLQGRIRKHIHEFLKFESKKPTKQVALKEDQCIKIVRNLISCIYGLEGTKIYDRAFETNAVVYDEDDKSTDDIKSKHGYAIYQPPFHKVVISKIGTMYDAIVLAHEIGHYMEYYSSNKFYFDTTNNSDLLAEVSSLTNEISMYRYLDTLSCEHYCFNDDLLDDYLNYEILHDYVLCMLQLSTIYIYYIKYEIAVLKQKKFNSFDDFEKIWEKEVISKLNDDEKKFVPKLLKFDENMNEVFNLAKFSRLDFLPSEYIYSFLVAHRIADLIQTRKPGFKEKYLDYLKAQSTLSFEEKLDFLGIDINDSSLIDDLEADVAYNIQRLDTLKARIDHNKDKLKARILKAAQEKNKVKTK